MTLTSHATPHMHHATCIYNHHAAHHAFASHAPRHRLSKPSTTVLPHPDNLTINIRRRCTPHVARHTADVARHTAYLPRITSRITRHASHFTRITLFGRYRMPHATRITQHAFTITTPLIMRYAFLLLNVFLSSSSFSS
jgi:hypothetical protein